MAVAKHVNCRKDGTIGKGKDGIKTNLYKKKNGIETTPMCKRENDKIEKEKNKKNLPIENPMQG